MGHDKNIKTVSWISWVDDGDKLCTSGTLMDDTNETILWDTKGDKYADPSKWTILFKKRVKLQLVLDNNRLV